MAKIKSFYTKFLSFFKKNAASSQGGDDDDDIWFRVPLQFTPKGIISSKTFNYFNFYGFIPGIMLDFVPE